MKIYTRKGDEGFTSLLGGTRVRKDDARVVALGSLDELNSAIGWVRCEAVRIDHVVISDMLAPVQSELLTLGSRVAALGTGKPLRDLPAEVVDRMEHDIDTAWNELPPLDSFILPGGCELACRLHMARAIGRRTERDVIHLLNPIEQVPLHDPIAVRYLNRFNDLLFALARLANRDCGVIETTWRSVREHT